MRWIDMLVPQLFALVGGTLAVRLAFASGRLGWLCAIGYGYVVGLIFGAVGLYVAGSVGLGVRFAPAAAIQISLCVLLGAALGLALRRDQSAAARVVPLPARSVGTWIALVIAALIIVRIASLGIASTAQPLYPWDAWQQWATKARVWFETGELKRFVSVDQWLQLSGNSGSPVYTDANPAYPPLVPLIQVWSMGPAVAWDDSAIGLTWPVLLAALGAAIAGQLYRSTGSWLLALIAAYLTLSLPILDTHAALAGYADLPLSVLYCMVFMAASLWARFRRKGDAALAILLLAFLPLFKRPGIVWALTFLPFLALGVSPGRLRTLLRGMLLLAFVGAAALILVHMLRVRGSIPGDSLASVLTNLFTWENWHLLWYLAIFLVLLHRSRRWSTLLSVAGTTLGLGVAFLAAVFWGTSLSASIADATTLNRALLPLGTAMSFFMALLVQRDVLRFENAAAIRHPRPKTQSPTEGPARRASAS